MLIKINFYIFVKIIKKICMREKYRLDKNIFIERSIKIHGNKYDYSKVEYKNHRTKVTIVCPIHGEFEQTPKNHMQGQGCPQCGKKYAQLYHKHNYKNFINSSIERFGDRYEFPNIQNEYENSHSKITIKCTKCGNSFVKIACDHITSPNGGCQHCYHTMSKPEEEIGEFIKSIIKDEIYFNDRELLNGYELDIFIPSKNIAIEFNGLYWHSEDKRDKYYHLMKTELCEQKGVHLIQIFEDEYYNSKDIVLSKIKHLLMVNNSEKIYARKCETRIISYVIAKSFLDSNHIQGHDKSTVYLGGFYNDELIGVMSFIKQPNNKWILNRFATNINKNVIGIGGKLFNWFIREYKPNEVKSFADRRWTSTFKENLYDKLGFTKDSILRPDYKYIFENSMKRFHKFNFRKKNIIKKYGLEENLTESEMSEKINAKKIWDCGLIKYVWRKKEI